MSEVFPTKEYEQTEQAELPVDCRRDEIVQLVADHQVTIIAAETGAGKSTRVPHYLYDTAQYDRIYVTQPRILAARNVSGRVAQQMTEKGYDGSALVGYRTSHEGNTTHQTVVQVVTDGLLLMKLLDEGAVGVGDVVVIDEFHERNTNMDVALALCIEQGIKVVIMSATLDIDRIERHYKELLGESAVGRIDIKGRMFPVEDHTSDKDRNTSMSETIMAAVRRQENVQAFVPGRTEARILESILRGRLGNDGPVILQLNGDQTPSDQQRCIASYTQGKIVISTPVGQTSITIPDIHTVVDCAWQRAGTYSNNIKAVPVEACSHATLDQRRGRVGRTMPGKYYQARLDHGPPFPTSEEDRSEYDIPNILRTDIIDIELRLAVAARTLCNMTALLDQPPESMIHKTHSRLVKLGALALDADTRQLTVTPEGRAMTQYPIDVQYARMVVEAAKVSPELQLKMIAAAAVMQVNGIASTLPSEDYNWRVATGGENTSDVIMQSKLFFKGLLSSADERRNDGITEQRFLKAKTYYESIATNAGFDPNTLTVLTDEDAAHIINCIILGSEHVYIRQFGTKYSGPIGRPRRLAHSSVILPESAPLIVGQPLDLGSIDKKGPTKHRIIVNATAVDVERLVAVLPPHRVRQEEVSHRFKKGKVVTELETYIDGRLIPRNMHAPAKTSNKNAIEAGLRAVFEGIITNDDLRAATAIEQSMIAEIQSAIDSLLKLQALTHENLRIAQQLDDVVNDILERHQGFMGKHVTLQEIAALLPSVRTVAGLVEESKKREIRRNAPLTVTIRGVEHPVDYEYNRERGESVARIEMKRQQIIDMTPGEVAQCQDDLGGRLVLFRASDRRGSSYRYMLHDKAVELYSRPTRAERRATLQPTGRQAAPREKNQTPARKGAFLRRSAVKNTSRTRKGAK
ncbi:MAG: helicase-related protein [Candidatus Saccharimonas sp.]